MRVDANRLRVTVVGEGGNLGVTEAAAASRPTWGVAINTDALDNSAGVDCSDHEVNVKIALQAAVASGALPVAERNALLASLTDDVGTAVLADNVAQNNELGFERARRRSGTSPPTSGCWPNWPSTAASTWPWRAADADATAGALRLHTGARAGARSHLARAGHPDGARQTGVESGSARLRPSRERSLRRSAAGDISRPRSRERFLRVDAHRLRREIISTSVVNDVVDLGGLSHVFRIGRTAGSARSTRYARSSSRPGLRPAAAVVAGHVVERWRRRSSTGCSTTRGSLLFRASRWFLAARPPYLGAGRQVARYRDRVARLRGGGRVARGGVAGRRGRACAALDRRGRRPQNWPAMWHAACTTMRCSTSSTSPDFRPLPPTGGRRNGWALCDAFIEQLLTAVPGCRRRTGGRCGRAWRFATTCTACCALTQTILDLGEPGGRRRPARSPVGDAQYRAAGPRRTTIAQVREQGEIDFASLSVAARALRNIAG